MIAVFLYSCLSGPCYKILGFPCDSAEKESACYVGDLGSITGLGRSPGEGKGYPLQFSDLYSPWGHKELDKAECLLLSLSKIKEDLPEEVKFMVTFE